MPESHTWTPAQAGEALYAAYTAWMKVDNDPRTIGPFMRDFMAQHWPQPQPITGRAVTGKALLDAVMDEGLIIPCDNITSDAWWAALDRAAARLSPQPVGVDADLLEFAFGIITNVSGGDWTQQSVTWHEAASRFVGQYNTWLERRHLTAAPPPSAPVVVPVEVTEADYNAALAAHQSGPPSVVIPRRVSLMNERIRARAADVVPCRVVRRPVSPQAGELVVPEDGEYCVWLNINPEWERMPMRFTAGTAIDARAIRRWSPVDGSTGPQIERTTTPQARPWEAGDVPDGEVAIQTHDGRWWFTQSANKEEIAAECNRTNVVQILVLPAEVPHAP